MTYSPADRSLELDPGLSGPTRLAQFVSKAEPAWLHSIERLTEHLAYAFGTLHRDDVPRESDQVAPVAVIDEQGRRSIDVASGQGPLEVCQPAGYDCFRSRCVDRSMRGCVGHRGTPAGGFWRFGREVDRAKYVTGRSSAQDAITAAAGAGHLGMRVQF